MAKVGKKVFVFMGVGRDDRLRLTIKLPSSGEEVLSMPFASPAGYGLDRGGWVDIDCSLEEVPPTDVVLAWVEESYRAVASKKLRAELDAALDAGADPADDGAP